MAANVPRTLQILNGFLDLVYPPKCLVCGNLGPEPLCANCLAGFPPLPRRICSHCGAPLEHKECNHCRFQPAENLAMARSAGIYDRTLRQAIIRLKYGRRRNLASALGRYLADFLVSRPFGQTEFDVVIPVPLHRNRLNERGFNQAALIAREVASSLSLPIVEECVERITSTRPQVELQASERAANVRAAFRCCDAQPAVGRRILLIDDVATTLSTGDACARALLAAGADSVHLATVARDI